MEYWYGFVDWLLPFPCFSMTFMKNALLAVLLVTPLFGLLGTLVVSNRMAFFSDSLGHAAFTGIALGALFALAQPLPALLAFSVLFALAITFIKYKSRMSADTVIGVFSATAIAAGVVIMSRGGGFAKYSAWLTGDILSITGQEIALLGGLLVVVVVAWLSVFNRLFIISINPALANSRGINPLKHEAIYAVLLAVTVAFSIKWVGLLIINSLLVLPAAAARNVAANVRQYHAWSLTVSLLSGVAGLVLSYYLDSASGATIVLVAALFFFVSLLFRRR